MAEKVRHSGLDIVRSTAILLVILQHSWSGLDLDVPSGAFSYWFYAPWMIGVPLFVMLSGALNLRRTQDPGDFLGKRFKRVLIPFLIWGTGVYILSALLGKYPQVDSLRSGVGYYFVALLEGGINQAYWFIYLLLGLYLITPVLQRAFDPDRPHSRRLLEYCLWLWVGVEICKEIYPSFLLLRYLAFPADLFLGYYLAGCYIFRYVPQGRMRSRYGLVGFLLSLCLNWILTAKGNPVGFVQISEAVCLFLYLSSLQIPLSRPRLGACVEDLSRYSYLIYLTHIVPVAALCAALPAPFAWAPPLIMGLVAFLEFVVCRILDRWRSLPSDLIGIG